MVLIHLLRLQRRRGHRIFQERNQLLPLFSRMLREVQRGLTEKVLDGRVRIVFKEQDGDLLVAIIGRPVEWGAIKQSTRLVWVDASFEQLGYIIDVTKPHRIYKQ